MDDVEKVKQKIDIVDLIGGYITLKKTGRNFKALCPFHGEKSPSFVVSADRQIWHCFGCQKGGDCFTFLMEYERIDFSESLKILADKAGISLSQTPLRTEKERMKDKIYTLNHLAASFYHFLLVKHSVGKRAYAYLVDERKVSEALIQTFILGYAPQNNVLLTNYLIRKKGYHEQDLIEAGLSIKKGVRSFDFFKHRIMFPLQDARGNILAFSGRGLDTNPAMAGPKYVNTRETPVYRKGDTFFGLNFAKDSIKKEGKAIVVEGEFDVISAFHEGITNIVAVKGTALTENQIHLLKRFAQKITFCFDTDPAGTAAQRRSIEMIEKEGIAASVIVLPQGKDPDELLRQDPATFKKAVRHDTNIYDFIIDTSLSGSNSSSAEGKKAILAKALPYLVQIENEVVKEHYLKKLAVVLDSSLESILKQAEKEHTQGKPLIRASEKTKRSREETLEEYLLALIFQSAHPLEFFEIAEKTLRDNPLTTSSYNKLLKSLRDASLDLKDFSSESFIRLLPAELIPTLDTCYLIPLHTFKDEKEYRQEIEKTAHEVRILSIKQRLRALEQEVKQKEKDGGEEDLERLRGEFHKLTQLLKE